MDSLPFSPLVDTLLRSARIFKRILLFSIFCYGAYVGVVFAEPPSTTAQTFTHILKHAAFAAASYENAETFKEACRGQKLEFLHSGAHLQDKVRFFIAVNERDKSQLITIRGTSNMENAVVDIDYVLTTDKLTGIELHTGFSQAARNIYREIQAKLRKDYTVNITGHSLGGAVAVILAMYLDKDGYTVGDVVTFGQPKVTNQTGAKRFEHLDVLRVNTADDMVPLVPPFDASQILNFKFDIFWHIGKEYILLSDQYYSVLEGMDSLMRGTDFLIKAPSEENIIAHRMDTYLKRLESLQKNAIEIPFEKKDQYLTPPTPAPDANTGLPST